MYRGLAWSAEPENCAVQESIHASVACSEAIIVSSLLIARSRKPSGALDSKWHPVASTERHR
jgi:hypothetical protein